MIRLRALWEYVRSTYWAVPSLMAVIAIALSVAMIHIDEVLTPKFVGTLSWVYTGGPQGARAVLSTIAGSMITVAGVTFSITIVALTLASQQFGPRLLRSFLRDLGNQIVLGTFVSTFIYCLLVLRTVRGNDDAQFVPHLAVTLGVLLAMLSLGVLIFFIHHVSTSIQASQIIANVAEDLEEAVVRLFPQALGHARPSRTASPTALPDDFDRDALSVPATTSGYVQAIDGGALLKLATERDVVLRVEAEPGRFVRKGTALVMVWPNAHMDDALGDVGPCRIHHRIRADTDTGRPVLHRATGRARRPGALARHQRPRHGPALSRSAGADALSDGHAGDAFRVSL